MVAETDLGPATGRHDDRGLRVDLLTPCFWPEVRRGTERFTRELADGLIERGHRPRLITGHPERLPSRRVEDGLPIVRVPRLPDARLQRRRWEPYVSHVPLSYAVLRAGAPDVAHAMNGPDAMAAVRYRRSTGRPAVFSFMGVPDHDGLYWFRKRLDFVLKAIAGCDAVVALSEAAAHGFRYWLGHDPVVIPPGVNLRRFLPSAERAPEPTIVCTADIAEERKNVPLVIEAFRLVRRQRPDARLVLSEPKGRPALGRRVVGDVEGVVLEDLDDHEALVRALSRSWVSVLASWGEAFGLVLAEALACGTPVVGSDSGGIPEIAGGDDGIGRLFDGRDAQALAAALLACFELSEDPATRGRCRRRAERFSTDATTDRYVDLYRELLSR